MEIEKKYEEKMRLMERVYDPRAIIQPYNCCDESEICYFCGREIAGKIILVQNDVSVNNVKRFEVFTMDESCYGWVKLAKLN